MAEYAGIYTLQSPPGPTIVNAAAVQRFEEAARADENAAILLNLPGLGLMPGVAEETERALHERDAKIAAIAFGVAYVLGVRGVVLIAIGAAPFLLKNNPTYRSLAWRIQL